MGIICTDTTTKSGKCENQDSTTSPNGFSDSLLKHMHQGDEFYGLLIEICLICTCITRK